MELQSLFNQLAEKWREDTACVSSISQLTEHPCYREIVSMGEAAVPLLIAELRRGPEHWFTALYLITGVDPVPSDKKGHLQSMAKAWIDWYDSQP